jgi:phosphoribosylaminoimidazolecarboxamide formyltransferase/IMP cyclohydrolase
MVLENSGLHKIETALISVYDKTKLETLTRALRNYGVMIFSSGGTAKEILKLGYDPALLTEVSAYTGFPEGPDGLVKTLHPKVHGGLLYSSEIERHRPFLSEHKILEFDLLVVNLYPFDRETQKNPEMKLENAAELIDIGGPAMIRGGAKGALLHGRPLVVTSPAQYVEVVNELTENKGHFPQSLALTFAARAFSVTANYEYSIAEFLRGAVLND